MPFLLDASSSLRGSCSASRIIYACNDRRTTCTASTIEANTALMYWYFLTSYVLQSSDDLVAFETDSEKQERETFNQSKIKKAYFPTKIDFSILAKKQLCPQVFAGIDLIRK